MLWLEDTTCKGRAVLTVYSKRGRCFRFSDHVLHHACIGALIRGGHLANNQGMVLQDFESGGRTDTQNQEMKDEVETLWLSWYINVSRGPLCITCP